MHKNIACFHFCSKLAFFCAASPMNPKFFTEYSHEISHFPIGDCTAMTNANLGNDEAPVADDYFNGVYEYIKQMLMEEDDELDLFIPCTYQECSVLQATEQCFYNALNNKESESSPGLCTATWNDENRDSDCFAQGSFLEYNDCSVEWMHGSKQNGVFLESNEENGWGRSGGSSSENQRKNRNVERRYMNGDVMQDQRSKQLGRFSEECEPTDKYDKAFLCPRMNPGFYNETADSPSEESSGDEDRKKYRKSREVKRGRPKGSKKQNKVKEIVDLWSLLTRCAQAVSTFDMKAAQEMLTKIQKHSSPYGDPTERLAHSFADALEARMAGTGSMLYNASASKRIPPAEVAKAYQTYFLACPFQKMSNISANKTIAKHTNEADKIHIIDFGIKHGFQWPCIIQGISLRPGGPPQLKITGIDFPQPGFKTAERIEQTGRRLKDYSKRFDVPLEYNPIAKKWEEIQLDDLKIEGDEMVVVNCIYRLRHVLDESAGLSSPRGAVLELIKQIKPCLFVHGVANGTHSAPFFITRFREALYHYSSLFDMLDATVPREDQERLLYEREVFGSEVMNVIACEGSERVERPETYKQCQARNQRAGFEQLPLNHEILQEVKMKVQRGYHGDFLLEEDGKWMLQGWRGRVLYALSFWKPLQDC